MDDTNDREYSRAPTVEDVITLCRSLNETGVRYVLIGGFAVIIHGSTRTTKDVDLLIDPVEENIRLVKKAMSYLPDNAIQLVADDDVRKYIVVRVGDEIVVDLMANACGINYGAAVEGGIEYAEVEGVRIPIAGKELLIRMKDTFRPSDKSDIGFLRLLIEEEKKARKPA